MIIRTVNGDIAPSTLGKTDCHNHIHIIVPDWVRKKDPDLALDDIEMNIQEMLLFKRAGGESFVDCTAIDYGREVDVLKNISIKSGVNIIAAAGFKEDPFIRTWLGEEKFEANKLIDRLVHEITKGVTGTKICCGVLKASTSYSRVTPLEEQVLKVVAKAHKITGAPIVTHSTSGTMGLEQLDIFESEGANLNQVSIGHCDLNPDPWYAKQIASRGAFVAYDSIGKIKYHPDSHRVEALKELVAAGYEKQILMGMDIGRKSDCKINSGGIGHGWLLSKFIPRLRSEGFSEDVLTDFLINNPKKWLSFNPIN